MKILTFDIEEWFHILDNPSTKNETDWSNYSVRIHENVDRILELLNKHNQKATFFCLGWIAEKYPEVIRKIFSEGHEIGSHSHMHQLAYEQNKKEYREDLKKSIDTLQQITGDAIEMYRAPGFSITKENQWTFDVMLEEGIKIDCSVFPTTRAHGGFKEFGQAKPCHISCHGQLLKEFPINFTNFLFGDFIYSGGGYFRVLPMALLRKLFAQGEYIMTYFHPRDFDANQPIIKNLSLQRRFKSYVGLGSALNKLDSLLKDHKFFSVLEADQKIEWSKSETIKLF